MKIICVQDTHPAKQYQHRNIALKTKYWIRVPSTPWKQQTKYLFDKKFLHAVFTGYVSWEVMQFLWLRIMSNLKYVDPEQFYRFS